MKAKSFLKAFLCTALSTLLLFRIPSVPVLGGEAPVLTIAAVQTTMESLAEDASVAVDVTLGNNPDGFLATSFGISYDPALTLEYVESRQAAGKAHCSAINADKHLVWFSGASAGADTAGTEDAETIFILHFTLPEDAAAGQSFPVTFQWNNADQKQGYWHTADRTNVIGGVQANAVNGSITISDPDLPTLSDDVLTLSVGDTKQLSVSNADSVMWQSSNQNIAEVSGGLVTAKAEGTCTIYAITGSTLLSCSLTVTKDATYDVTEKTTVYLRDPEKQVTLTHPETESGCIWLSMDTRIVAVDNGTLRGISNGTAQVVCSCGTANHIVQVIVEYPAATSGTGDVTLDNEVNILDVLALNRNLLIGETLSSPQQLAADVDLNTHINFADSLNILKHVIGLIQELPLS